jgi:hypothetical protein
MDMDWSSNTELQFIFNVQPKRGESPGLQLQLAYTLTNMFDLKWTNVTAARTQSAGVRLLPTSVATFVHLGGFV